MLGGLQGPMLHVFLLHVYFFFWRGVQHHRCKQNNIILEKRGGGSIQDRRNIHLAGFLKELNQNGQFKSAKEKIYYRRLNLKKRKICLKNYPQFIHKTYSMLNLVNQIICKILEQAREKLDFSQDSIIHMLQPRNQLFIKINTENTRLTINHLQMQTLLSNTSC